MGPLQLIGPSYNLESRPASVQRTINMMPVPLEPGNERTSWVFKDVPGLVLFQFDDPYARVIYEYTGEQQEFVVPDGITAITVRAWGGGGGAGRRRTEGAISINTNGGAGGYVEETLVVVPGETLGIQVGGGGTSPVSTQITHPDALNGLNNGWPDAGTGGIRNNGARGGGGGGSSKVFRLADALIIAPGGGGGGSDFSDGYAGGGLEGGGAAHTSSDDGVLDGGPATQTTGGIRGNNGDGSFTNFDGGPGDFGGQGLGGGGANGTGIGDDPDNAGGAGGGGYHGGGGGAGTDESDGGGAGGSALVGSGFTQAGVGAVPYQGASYQPGIARGGGSSNPSGGNGLVVISYLP